GAFLAVIAFLLMIGASFISAVNLGASFAQALRFLQLVVLFAAVRQLVTDRDKLRTLAIVSVSSMSISALVGIYQFAFHVTDRITGISQNAAILAADLIVAL